MLKFLKNLLTSKTFYATVFVGVVIGAVNAHAQFVPPLPWYLSGSNWITYESTHELGSTSNRIAKGWFDELDVSTLTGGGSYTDSDVDAHLSGGTGITYSSGAITFDCSEVEGTGINCSGEAITLDATGDWTGTFDGLEVSQLLRSDTDGSVNGSLTVTGNATGTNIEATEQILAPVIHATGTAATSTFAGGLAIETSGLVYDFSSNNVGIGTAAPLAKLDVVQTSGDAIKATNAEDNYYYSGYTGGTQFFGVRKRSNHIELQTFSSQPLYLNPLGNDVYLTHSGTELTIGATTVDGKFSVTQTNAADIFNLYDSSVNVLTVLDGGNVGIGTSSPYAKLSIADGVVFGQFDATSTATSTIATGGLEVSGHTHLATTTTGMLNGVLVIDGDNFPYTSAGVQSAVTSYERVHMPCGTYAWSAKVTVPSNRVVSGEGGCTVIDVQTNTNNYVFENADTSGGNTHIVLRDFKIDGNQADQSSATAAINLVNVSTSTLKRIHVTDTAGGFRNVNVHNVEIYKNYLDDPKDNKGAFGFEQGSTHNKVTENTVKGYTLCVNLDGSGGNANHNTIADNTFLDNTTATGGDCILVVNGSSHNSITGNTIRNFREDAIRLSDDTSYNTVTGNNIYDTLRYGIVLTERSNHNTITGNTVASSSANGIFIDDYASYNTISSNTVATSSTDGIQLNAYANHNEVIGNTIHNAGRHGIYLPTTKNNKIKHNFVDGAGIGANGIYLLNSSSTEVIGNTIQDFTSSLVRVQETIAGSTELNRFVLNDLRGETITPSVGFNLVNGSEDPDNNKYYLNEVVGVTTKYSSDPGTGNVFMYSNSDGIAIGGNATTTGQHIVSGNLGIGTSTPRSQLHVSAGPTATTTVEWGDPTSTSQVCHNTKNAEGSEISFYFVGTTMVVENNRCVE